MYPDKSQNLKGLANSGKILKREAKTFSKNPTLSASTFSAKILGDWLISLRERFSRPRSTRSAVLLRNFRLLGLRNCHVPFLGGISAAGEHVCFQDTNVRSSHESKS